jgi:hypothetical protein
MEVVGGYVDTKNIHVSTVGTVFFVGAGTSASIKSPDIALTAAEDVPEVTAAQAAAKNSTAAALRSLYGTPLPPPAVASAATTNKSTLNLTPTAVTLTAGLSAANPNPAMLSLTNTGGTLRGSVQGNAVSILSNALTINHATSASLSSGAASSVTASAASVTIQAAETIINGDGGVKINGPLINLGQPVVTNAALTTQLAAAQEAAAAATQELAQQLANIANDVEFLVFK